MTRHLRIAAGAALLGALGLVLAVPAAAQTSLAPEDWAHKESPMLREMVEAGDLPPLEERLPANPRVVEVHEEIGRFGGTMVNGVAFLRSEYIPYTLTLEPFFEVDWPLPGDAPVQANIAETWSFNEEGTELTINLREGTKWSDGEAFTADDVIFHWEDILLDEQVARTPPPQLRVNGELPTLEKVDDLTIKFTFAAPFFFAETVLASMYLEAAWPKHVMSELHPKYNSEATYENLNENLLYFNGRGRVTLGAWILEDYFPGEKFVLVRNPYYWKVDAEGNQLPYIDRVEIREVEDRQAVALGNISGEFDSDGMWVGVQHLQLFLEEQEGRQYDIGWGTKTPGMAMYLNYDAVDPVVRSALRDVSFRRAWSLAINRDEINFVLFNDLLTPSGWAFSQLSPYYVEEDAQLWVQHDPDEAKSLLEEAGYVDVDGDGYREAPDGSPLDVIIDVSQHDLYVPVNEMVAQQLGDVGIKATLNVQHQDLIEQRRLSDEWQVHIWDIYGFEEPLAELQYWAPVADGEPFWHQNGAQEPFSPAFDEYSDLMLKAPTLPFEQRVETMKKAGHIMADNVFHIYLGDYERPFIKGHRLGNLSDTYARLDIFGGNMPAFRYHQTFLRSDRE